MRVQSLGQEDPLEEEMATHSSILARGIPWTEEAGGLQTTGAQRSDVKQLSTHAHTLLTSACHGCSYGTEPEVNINVRRTSRGCLYEENSVQWLEVSWQREGRHPRKEKCEQKCRVRETSQVVRGK